MKINIPLEAKIIIKSLQDRGFKAYIVGGCVRDGLLGSTPKDWDICTNCSPEEVMRIFQLNYKVIPTGLKHGTVTVIIDKKQYEVTTFRKDGDYSDNRRPDKVEFVNDLYEDLSRRDFTINAMCYNEEEGLIDYFNGKGDLEKKLIKCVGNPKDRFNEDALRMLRAVRFASQLKFFLGDIAGEIEKNSHLIQNISIERINDELCKILLSPIPAIGMLHLANSKLLKYIIPELIPCIDFNQHNRYHDKDVYRHILEVVNNTPPKLELRLSALFHDIGKPKCFEIGEDKQGHFINHHKESADMAREIMKRLRFDNKTIDKVCLLVYEHMNRNPNMSNKAIKKFIGRVGVENLDDLFELQIADIKACAKAYQDYHGVLELKEKCNKISIEKEPLSTKDLMINGKDLIELGYKQGKEIGDALNYLLELVLENSKLNTKENLIKIINCKEDRHSTL